MDLPEKYEGFRIHYEGENDTRTEKKAMGSSGDVNQRSKIHLESLMKGWEGIATKPKIAGKGSCRETLWGRMKEIGSGRMQDLT